MTFTDRQIEDLHKSGIPLDIATTCGIENETDDKRIFRDLSWPEVSTPIGSALRFPYYPEGDSSKEPLYVRYKPDTPFTDKTGTRKYIQPLGIPTDIYIPPLPNITKKIFESEADLFITEGEKKALALSFNEYPAVAISGIWCAYHKGTRILKDVFDKMRLRGRTIYIIFDLKEFEKPDVLHAKVELAEALTKKGAIVRLLHLSDDPELIGIDDDLGVDDYLATYGKERFAEVLNRFWHYPIDPESLDQSDKRELGSKLLAYNYFIKNPWDHKLIKEFMTKKLGLDKEDISRFNRQFKNTKFKFKKDTYPIYWGDDRPYQEKFAELIDYMKSTGNYFRGGPLLMFINHQSKRATYIPTHKEFSGPLQEIKFYKQGENRTQFVLPSPHELDTFLSTSEYIYKFDELVTVANHPIYNQNYELIEEGYDPSEQIYVFPSDIKPRMSFYHLKKILDAPAYADDGSKSNRLALLLPCLMPTLFQGKKPLILNHGNQPGVGKSWAAETDGIIRSGDSSYIMSYTTDEGEMEKQFVTAIYAGATDIVLDNAKISKRMSVISSGVLERNVTSEKLTFRLLGGNKKVEKPNNIQFSITANSPQLSTDLISRSLVVNFYYQGDPSEREFSFKDDPRKYAKENRSEILGELLGLVEVWKAKGKPLSKKKHRFQSFAEIIGGILEANSFEGFLDNKEAIMIEMSDEYQDMLALLNLHPDVKGIATELYPIVMAEKLFQGELSDKGAHANKLRLANIFKRYANRLFKLDNGETRKWIVKEDKRRKSPYFCSQKFISNGKSQDAGSAGCAGTSNSGKFDTLTETSEDLNHRNKKELKNNAGSTGSSGCFTNPSSTSPEFSDHIRELDTENNREELSAHISQAQEKYVYPKAAEKQPVVPAHPANVENDRDNRSIVDGEFNPNPTGSEQNIPHGLSISPIKKKNINNIYIHRAEPIQKDYDKNASEEKEKSLGTQNGGAK